MEKRNIRLILVLILIVGLILRIISINWGLPNNDHQYSYCQDEQTNLTLLKNINLKEWSFDLKQGVSGHLGYYLLGIPIFLGKGLGIIQIKNDPDFYRNKDQQDY